MAYQIQVRGTWAGSDGGWRPAIDGSVNQTGQSAEEASTFESRDDAIHTYDAVIKPELPEGEPHGDARPGPEFRLFDLITGCAEIGHL